MSNIASTSGDAGLSKLTPAEERKWSRLGNKMEELHTYLKYEFDEIYALADGKYTSRGMSLSDFLQSTLDFQSHLETHSNIEERFLFPRLAKKMPAFRDNEQHLNAHKQIHGGLHSLSDLVARFRSAPTTYSPTELRACMDGFRGVMTQHFAEEVNDLKSDNMRQYYTLTEFERIPM